MVLQILGRRSAACCVGPTTAAGCRATRSSCRKPRAKRCE